MNRKVTDLKTLLDFGTSRQCDLTVNIEFSPQTRCESHYGEFRLSQLAKQVVFKNVQAESIDFIGGIENNRMRQEFSQ